MAKMKATKPLVEQIYPDNVLHNLSIDNLIFCLDGRALKVLLIKRGDNILPGQWGLPGGWIKENEDLRDAANRILKEQTNVDDLYLEQLKTFGKVNRYPYTRVVTVAYYALINASTAELRAGFSAEEAAWFNIRKIPELVFDHKEILDFGIQHLQHKIRHYPIGFNLLPEKFTLLQLQELYQAILDIELDKPNFRRKIMKMNLLKKCEEKQQGVAHRAASLFRFDIEAYNKLSKQGFTFEV